MSAPAYLASDDSALLRRAIEGHSGQTCLEIGAGNGGNLIAFSGGYGLAVGTDLVRPEMNDWSGAGANYLLADLASCFRDETFDAVVFNPPYLRSEKVEDVAVDAGLEGEVPLAFLREALRVVKSTGFVLMLLSQDSPLERVREECARKAFRLTRTESTRMFFEELSVYKASAEAHPELGRA